MCEVRIILGKGENAVQIHFNEHELTAVAIETAIYGMRETLGEEQAPGPGVDPKRHLLRR